MDSEPKDADPDLRWFCTWGMVLIAVGFFLQWCGCWQDVGPMPDWQPTVEEIEEWRAD